MEPKKQWIRTEIGKAVFHSPDGSSITYGDKNKGYILDRALMQKELALDCQEKGVDCYYGTTVTLVGPFNGKREIQFADGSIVQAEVVVDCSGPLSTIGKSENIQWKAPDLEPAFLAHVTNADLGTPLDTVHVYAGQLMAPGGYVWAFPRGEKEYNVGLIVGRQFRKGAHIRKLLAAYITDYLPGSKIVKTLGGSIPCYVDRAPTACPGLIKAGDSASCVNPISRAGIVEAMMSGQNAGKTALEMLGATTEKQLVKLAKKHEKEWYKLKGKRLHGLAKVKDSLAKVPDEDYDAATRAMSAAREGDLTMSQIFKLCLGRFPKLVWALRNIV